MTIRITDLYIKPGRSRVAALNAHNLLIDEVRVGDTVVDAQPIQKHKQQSVGEGSEHSSKDLADYVTDDYRAGLKAERTQGDIAIPLGPADGG